MCAKRQMEIGHRKDANEESLPIVNHKVIDRNREMCAKRWMEIGHPKDATKESLPIVKQLNIFSSAEESSM